MIHIATIHWQTDKWINIQLNYLKKYIKEDFRVYAFLNDIDKKYNKLFFYSNNEKITEHYIKLNLLGDIISNFSGNKDNDLLIFLDGDAFPIGDIIPFIKEKIKEHKLLAIQRLENGGDIQPHPSFCATTIGFWKEIDGSWARGFKWTNNRGHKLSDVGGNLLKNLDDRSINWYKMLRSGQLTDHELWYGIYDKHIYHHGAGFRIPASRFDKHEKSFFLDVYFNIVNKLPFRIQRRLQFKRAFFKKNIKMSENIYEMICSENFNFENIF